MIKYLGAFMILLSGLSLGLGRVMEGRRRIGTLRSVLAALELMQGELGANAAPLPELCTALCRRASPPAEDFFQTLNASLDRLGEEDFAALWDRAAEKELFALKNGELEEIKALGNIIGRYELDAQLSALRAAAAAIRLCLDRALAEYPGERKLGLMLPTALSALLALALL